MSCLLCPEKAEVTIEDWAMLVVQNGNDTQVIESDAKRFQAICGFDENDPTIDSLLTNAPTVIDAVSTAIGQFNVTNVISAANEIVSFLESSILEDECEKLLVDEYTSFTGDTTFFLNPGEQLKVTLISNAKFGGKIINHGNAIGSINSDFYLAGVLTTIPDSTDGVPAYCECEKIASYTVGSLEPFTPSTNFIIDEPNNEQVDWTSIFLNSPFNLSTMQQLTGAFIGTAAEWGNAFELKGCCDVVIPCHSDCVFLRGCGDEQVVGRISNASIIESFIQEFVQASDSSTNITLNNSSGGLKYSSNKINLNNTNNHDISGISVFPNPTGSNSKLSVLLDKNFKISNLKVLDINGSPLQINMDINENISKINMENLNKGMYIIVITDQYSNIYLNKFIKQ